MISPVPPAMTPTVCTQICIQPGIATALHGGIFVLLVQACNDGRDINKLEHMFIGGPEATNPVTPHVLSCACLCVRTWTTGTCHDPIAILAQHVKSPVPVWTCIALQAFLTSLWGIVEDECLFMLCPSSSELQGESECSNATIWSGSCCGRNGGEPHWRWRWSRWQHLVSGIGE